jgi:hypothetical protein
MAGSCRFPIDWGMPSDLRRSESQRGGANSMHNGVMTMANRDVRQSVSLPANVAAQVHSLAKARGLSANRMLLELIENGMEAESAKSRNSSTSPIASGTPPILRKSNA